MLNGMLRVTAKFLVSARWSLCSGQLMSLIADGSGAGQSSQPASSSGAASMKSLQAARHFLRDIDVPRVVQIPDDTLELLYFMQRVDYPKNSRLEEAAKLWLSQHGTEFTTDHLMIMCRYAVEQEIFHRKQQRSTALAPSLQATELWTRVAFRAPWFHERFPELLKSLNVESALLVAKVLSWTATFEGPLADQRNPLQANDTTSVLSSTTPESVYSQSNEVLSTGISSEGYRNATAQRCAELLKAKFAQPLSPDAIGNVIRYVVPFLPNSTNAVDLVHLHLSSQGLEEITRLIGFTVTSTSCTVAGSAQSQILSLLVGRCADAVASRNTSTGAPLTYGCRSLQSALYAVRNPQGNVALVSAIQKAIHALISIAKTESKKKSQVDRKGLIALAELIAMWESQVKGGAPSSEGNTVVEAARAGGSQGLTLLTATILSRELAAREMYKSLIDTLALPTTTAATVAVDDASNIMHAVQMGLMRSRRDGDEVTTSSGQPRALSRSSVLGRNGLAHLTSLSAKCCGVMLRDRFALGTQDIVSLLFVMLSVGEALGPEGAAAATTGLLTTESAALQQQSDSLRTLADDLIQRLLLASKFSRRSSAGSSSTLSNASQSSDTSGGAVDSSLWSLELVRTLVLGLGCIGYPSSRQPVLVDSIQGAISKILQDFDTAERRSFATDDEGEAIEGAAFASLQLWQVTEFLVALSDTQLFQGAASRLALRLIHTTAAIAPIDDVVHCLMALSVLQIRDIETITMLISTLTLADATRRAQLHTRHIVHVADAVRRLRLLQLYQSGGISQSMTSLLLNQHPAPAPIKGGSSSKSRKPPAPAMAYPKADYVSLEEFSLLLSCSDVDEQRRLFQLLHSSLVSDGRAAAGLHVTLLETFQQELGAYLKLHPTVCLSLLSCKECPEGFINVIDQFLTSAAPLEGDAADPELFVTAFATIEALVLMRKKKPGAASTSTAKAEMGEGLIPSVSLLASRCSGASLAPSAHKREERMFAHLCSFGNQAIFRMQEGQLMVIVATALRLDELPNSVFRAIGRRASILAEGLSPENALLCLTLYAKYRIRDDRVVKAMLNRCILTIAVIGSSSELTATLQRICDAYPHWSGGVTTALSRYSAIKSRRERRIS